LIANLDASLPDNVVFDTGQLGPSTVDGWAQVGMTIDGLWGFTGSVHESGAVGHNYAFALALDPVDASGLSWTFVREGHVSGTFDIGFRDDLWTVQGYFPSIAENWYSVKAAAKASHYKSTLQVSTQAIQVIEAIAAALAIAAAAIFLMVVGGGEEEAQKWDCTFLPGQSQNPDESPPVFSCVRTQA